MSNLIYQVFIKLSNNNIIDINSDRFIRDDITNWIKIDEGFDDKYLYCQTSYFDKPIYTEDGYSRYKLCDGKVIERTEEEINVDRLPLIKQSKISECHSICNNTIYNGLDLELSAGSEHFDYKEKDQINIKAMFDAVVFGATRYPYQADDGKCRIFPKEDIKTLYSSLEALRTSQITYYNQLKDYINTLNTIDEINAVTYGQELTGEYLDHYNEMMQVANEEMQLVLSRITMMEQVNMINQQS